MDISTRLNELMQPGDGHPKLSQTDLSKLSGVPQPTIARILAGRGKKGPETATLVALSKVFGVEFMWLQQGTGAKYPGGKAASDPAPALPVPHAQPRFRKHWLSQEEADHLADFRSLSTKNQKRVRAATREIEGDDVSGGAVDEV